MLLGEMLVPLIAGEGADADGDTGGCCTKAKPSFLAKAVWGRVREPLSSVALLFSHSSVLFVFFSFMVFFLQTASVRWLCIARLSHPIPRLFLSCLLLSSFFVLSSFVLPSFFLLLLPLSSSSPPQLTGHRHIRRRTNVLPSPQRHTVDSRPIQKMEKKHSNLMTGIGLVPYPGLGRPDERGSSDRAVALRRPTVDMANSFRGDCGVW